MSNPSSSVATTVPHSGPRWGTKARRSHTTPAWAAASAPNPGIPTTATHAPAAEAGAIRASTRELVPGATATVLPRRRAGSNGRSSGATGKPG